MTTFTVWVLCEPLEVDVRLAEADTLTPLERLVIEAIHAGVRSFADLVAMFGLGDRLMLDVVFDLWRAGHVLVDTFAGMVALTHETAVLAADGRLTEVKALPGREEPRTLMQETLTGHVLSSRHSVSAARRQRTIVPPTTAPAEVGDIRASDIARAVLDDLRRDRAETAGLKVLSAQIKLTQPKSARRFWLPVTVRTTIVDGGDDGLDVDRQLRIEVLSESVLPHGVREEMARRLTSLVETQPSDGFVAYLWDNASESETHAPGAEESIAMLYRATGELDTLDAGLVVDRHELLRERANTAEGQILRSRDTSVDVELLVGNASQRDAVLEMLGQATRQVVICSPWIREDRLKELLPAMERAVARGVQIFLLWGIESDGSALTPEIQRLLQRLSGPRFTFSQRSAGTHAKLVIQDDQRALITSANILSGRDQRVLELGFSVTRRAGALRSRPIERLLAWAREHYPEYVPARTMYVLAEEFVDDREALQKEDLGVLTVAQPSPPAWTPEDGYALPARRLWASAWRRYADDLARTRATMPGRRIRVVSDAQHRLQLADALATARTRLIIASDQLSDDVVDQRFLTRLARRLDERDGLSVVLIHQRMRQAPEDLEGALHELAERHSSFRVLQRPSHAKVLVCDDVVTISSFNYLSFEGVYLRGATGGVRYRQRTELGLEAEDAALADAVLTALSEFAGVDLLEPSAREEAPRGRAAAATDAGAARIALAELEVVRNLLGSAPPGSHALMASLAAATRVADDPGRLLAELDDAALAFVDRRSAIAEALLGGRLRPEEHARWLDELIQDRIAEEDFVGAALLRSAARSAESQAPDPTVLTLAAALYSDSFDQAADEVLTLPEGDRQWLSVAVLGAVRVAGGDPDGMLLVELGRDAAGPAWGQVLDALADFWTSFYRAVPMQALSSQASSQAARAAVEEGWKQLDQALTAAEAKRMTPSWAAEIHARVHHAEAPFGRLRKAIDDRDHGAVIAWWELNGRRSLGAVIDDVAGDEGTLHHANRETYLKLLRATMQATKQLARTNLVGADDPDPAALERATTVQQLVQSLGPLLEQETVASPRSVSPILAFSHVHLERLLGLAVGVT